MHARGLRGGVRFTRHNMKQHKSSATKWTGVQNRVKAGKRNDDVEEERRLKQQLTDAEAEVDTCL